MPVFNELIEPHGQGIYRFPTLRIDTGERKSLSCLLFAGLAKYLADYASSKGAVHPSDEVRRCDRLYILDETEWDKVRGKDIGKPVLQRPSLHPRQTELNICNAKKTSAGPSDIALRRFFSATLPMTDGKIAQKYALRHTSALLPGGMPWDRISTPRRDL
ncbi:hypothetical protein C8Q73DRAFT_669648 [Cubamyces lactineus]|nr:hypothetical protein C8Q73DRAFT_669648 [Cubamyces lactineus]